MGLIRTLHAWTGAILALLLIVLGLTGALLAFKDDWVRLTLPEARAAATFDPAAIGAAAQAIEEARPGRVSRVVFAGHGLGVHRIFYKDGRHGYAAGDGRIVTEWTGYERPDEWVYELHHFLLAGDSGMRVAGAAALIGAVLVLTGLTVWLPAWRSFGLRVLPRTGKRRDLIATHRNLGVLFSIPVFVFCLTGGAIVFYQTTQSWLSRMLPGPEPEPFFSMATNPGPMDWPKALASAQAAFPGSEVRAAIWPTPQGIAVIRLRQPGEWYPEGRTQVAIDPGTSRVLETVDAKALGRGMRLNNAIYPIHAAAVGGRIYDLITALSGVALAALGGFGLWSFLIKPRRKTNSQA